nr:hypothetical protein [uncultured Undibacterium sp.]
MQVPGNASTANLLHSLEIAIGADSFRLIGEFGSSFDAFGFCIIGRERYLFSISTHAGELPHGNYEFQISITDETLENGKIVLLECVDAERFLVIVKEVISGNIS